jgi:hypothetical protein
MTNSGNYSITSSHISLYLLIYSNIINIHLYVLHFLIIALLIYYDLFIEIVNLK